MWSLRAGAWRPARSATLLVSFAVAITVLSVCWTSCLHRTPPRPMFHNFRDGEWGSGWVLDLPICDEKNNMTLYDTDLHLFLLIPVIEKRELGYLWDFCRATEDQACMQFSGPSGTRSVRVPRMPHMFVVAMPDGTLVSRELTDSDFSWLVENRDTGANGDVIALIQSAPGLDPGLKELVRKCNSDIRTSSY